LRHLSVRSFYNKIDPLAENFFDVKILSNRFIHGIEKIIRVYLTPTVFLIIKRVNYDKLVKSLILLAPQAILGFMTRLAKLQELGLTPSNSLQFLTPDASSIFFQNCSMSLTKDFLRNRQIIMEQKNDTLL